MTGGRSFGPLLIPLLPAFIVVLSAPISIRAAFPEQAALEGDWEIQSRDEGQRLAILSFSGDAEGDNLAGWWITDAGWSELEDISREDGQLRFTWNDQNGGGGPMTWEFSGRVEEDNLRGTVSNDRVEREVAGERIPRMPEIVGNWAFSYTREQVTLALVVRVGDDGQLTLAWRTTEGHRPITDFTYEAGLLTFTSDGGDYEGRLTGPDALNGTLTVDQRAYSVLASRMGTPVIGTWELEITSEGGVARQRLNIRPDMSGWYGTSPIAEVRLAHDVPVGPERASRKVTFHAVSESDERDEVNFVGEVMDATLTGEITNSAGRSTVAGRKLNSPLRSGEES